MGQKITVAIIGALTSLGSSVAKTLTLNYRLLLVDKNDIGLFDLKADLQTINNNSEIELFNCCKEASWEADIIILSANLQDQVVFSSKFKEVANCKTVITIATTDNIHEELKSILPNSKVVNVLVNASKIDQNKEGGEIDGIDREAHDIIDQIITNSELHHHI